MGMEASDLDRLPAGELKRRAEEHLRGAAEEFKSARADVWAMCGPGRLVRKHPLGATAAAGIAAFLALRLLRRRKRRSDKGEAEPPKAERVRNVFGRSFLSGLVRASGKALSGVVVRTVTKGFGARRGKGAG